MSKCELECAVGSYIYIDVEANKMQFFTDASGDITIYYYCDKKYWAVSNSFWMLQEDVQKHQKLTLNTKIAIHNISAPLSSLAIGETIINEISCISRFEELIIENGELSIHKKPCNIFDTELSDSIDILDEWIDKWSRILKAIEKSEYTLKFDLSGGFDSRMTFALAVAAGIDFNKNNVFVQSIVPSTKGQVDHLKDDYEIASLIAEKLDFKLNRSICDTYKELNTDKSVEIFEETMLCNHREAYFFNGYATKPVFHFGGYGGETVRGDVHSVEEWLKMIDTDCNGMEGIAKKVFLESYDKCKVEGFSSEKCDEFASLTMFWMETWQKYHFGETILYRTITNEIVLSPLTDPLIYRIQPFFKGEPVVNIIYSLILQRTAPWLLEIPLSGGRAANEKAIQIAKDLLNDKMRIKRDYTEIEGIQIKTLLTVFPEGEFDAKSAEKLFASYVLADSESRNTIKKLGIYGRHLLTYAENKYEDDDLYYPNRFIAPLRSISKCGNIENYSMEISESVEKFIKDNLVLSKELLEKYPDSDNLQFDVKKYQLLNKLVKKFGNTKNIIVYGVGRLGKLIVPFIRAYLSDFNLKLAVTECNGRLPFYNGMEIKNFNELDMDRENTVVLLATINDDFCRNMKEYAGKAGYKEIVSLFD